MGVIFRFFLLVETTQTLMPPFNRKAASVDEKLPKLPEFECSQSLQGVEAELAAVNGLFRLSNSSRLNLQMDEPEDDGRGEVKGPLDLASVEPKRDVLLVRKKTTFCSDVEVHYENPNLLSSSPDQESELGAG